MHPPAPDSPTRPQSWLGVAAAVVGNMLEFYDFTVYAFFAVYIGKAFFPARDGFTSLLLTVATFGVGFVTRPLGAVVIGGYADRGGRKPALILTISLMAVGMVLLAVTPGYATIGLAAPLIIVVARLIQGFALGGDVGPASAFLIENAPPAARGLHGSGQIASQGASTMLAGLVGVALSSTLSAESMQARGWRIAMLLGLLVVPAGILMRRAMPETLKEAGNLPREPVLAVLARLRLEHGRTVLLSVLIFMAGTVATYTGNYLTTYAMTTLHMPATTAIGATAVVGFCSLTGALAGGWMSDRWGRKRVTAVSRITSVVLVYPIFVLMSRYPTLPVFYAMAALLAWANAPSSSVGTVFIAEAFPTRLRSIGLATTYAFGISVFGGTTQFVVVWLIGTTGNPLAPAWYVAATGSIGFVATLLLEERSAAAPLDVASLRQRG